MMSRDRLIAILDAHSIPFEEADGRIMADECVAFGLASFVDVTDLGATELREWLGY